MATVATATAELWQALRSGARTLPLPATITVTGGTLHCDELLRIVPGKRAVLRGEWQGRPVLAKLFTAAGRRQAEREQEGYRLLQAAAIPTPELLAVSQQDDQAVLLFEWLAAAEPLVAMHEAPDEARMALLLDLAAQLHRAGLYQSDLHGGNFLLSEGRAWCIDAASVVKGPAEPLPPAEVVENLALLIAQFPLREQSQAQQLVLAHPVTAGVSAAQREMLPAAVVRRWRVRRDQYLGKCFRDTTEIAFHRQSDRVYACRRARLGPELTAFFADPDAAMRTGEMLKDGNSATVVRRLLDGRPVVIKRYNIKNGLHALRRFWRPSRAWVSWRNAHHLQLLGLSTPPPVAFLERRIGPFRGRAWYISDHIEGEPLLGLFEQREPTAQEHEGLADYFRLATREQLVHGDMKATNLFADGERVWILDLDAMRTVGRTARWRALFARDLARFARNWQRQPEWLRTLLDIYMPVSGQRKIT